MLRDLWPHYVRLMLRRPAILILAAFALSVAVRLPHVGRPLSGHHEFCTALVLIFLQNWWTDGYTTLHGGPAHSFTTPADRFPPTEVGPHLHEGVLYYFSHPPLAYDLPYALFRLSGSAPNAVGLEWLNILFHLVSAWCLFRIVQALSPGDAGERAGVFAAVLYLFLPAPLWFHGNAYMSDMFVQNFWLLHLAVAVPVFRSVAPPTFRQQVGMAGWLFLTVYTSWLGVWAGAVVVVMALWRRWHTGASAWSWTAVACSAAVLAALALMLWRYAQVVPLQDVLIYLGGRLEARDAAALPLGLVATMRQILVNYRTGFLPVILLLVVLAVLWQRRVIRPALDRRSLLVLLVFMGVPVLLDHAVLLEYSIHDFTVLKAGPLLCALAGVGLAALSIRAQHVALAVTCVCGVLYYFRTNPPPAWTPERYAWEQRVGLQIRAEARPDEPVFILGAELEPQVWWYARRTIFRVDDRQQVQAHLAATGHRQGILFTRAGDGLVFERVRRVQP